MVRRAPTWYPSRGESIREGQNTLRRSLAFARKAFCFQFLLYGSSRVCSQTFPCSSSGFRNHGMPTLVFRREKLGHRHFHPSVAGAQNSVEGLEMTFTRDGPSASGWRIENPDVGNAHGEVIVQTRLEFWERIVRRKNFNADVWRLRENLLVRFWQRHYAHVGNSKTPGRNSYPLFRDGSGT